MALCPNNDTFDNFRAFLYFSCFVYCAFCYKRHETKIAGMTAQQKRKDRFLKCSKYSFLSGAIYMLGMTFAIINRGCVIAHLECGILYRTLFSVSFVTLFFFGFYTYCILWFLAERADVVLAGPGKKSVVGGKALKMGKCAIYINLLGTTLFVLGLVVGLAPCSDEAVTTTGSKVDVRANIWFAYMLVLMFTSTLILVCLDFYLLFVFLRCLRVAIQNRQEMDMDDGGYAKLIMRTTKTGLVCIGTTCMVFSSLPIVRAIPMENIKLKSTITPMLSVVDIIINIYCVDALRSTDTTSQDKTTRTKTAETEVSVKESQSLDDDSMAVTKDSEAVSS